MKKLLPALTIACAIGVSIAPRALAASAFYTDGVKDYVAGHYEQAVVKLARASGEEPGNAMVHYYLANALAQVHQHDEAAKEYRIAYILDPAGSVAGFCKQALAGYKMPLPDDQEIKQQRATIFNGSPRVGRAEIASKTATQAPPISASSAIWSADKSAGSRASAVQQSLSVIRRQLEYEKAKNQNYSSFSAEHQEEEAQAEIKQARQRMEAEIQRVQLQMYGSHSLNGQAYLQSRIDQIRAAEKEEEERIVRQAAARADRYKKVGEMKDSALDQVAKDLETQMSDNSPHSGVKLIPQGTDLYVRQYASANGQRAVPDVHAAVARIYGSGGTGVTPAEDGLQTDISAGTKLVRGKLLRQPAVHVWSPVQL